MPSVRGGFSQPRCGATPNSDLPVSLARKLQALNVIEFPGLEFTVYRVGLLPRQVQMYGLACKATQRVARAILHVSHGRRGWTHVIAAGGEPANIHVAMPAKLIENRNSNRHLSDYRPFCHIDIFLR